MCKVVIYKRVSTDKQGVVGLGMQAQDTAIENYLRGVPNHQIIDTFVEVESGKKANRPELAKAIRKAKATNSLLVIAKLDRLARNLNFLTTMMESRLRFVACDMPEVNETMLHFMGTMAQAEAKAISERTSAALQAKMKAAKAKAEAEGTEYVCPLGKRDLHLTRSRTSTVEANAKRTANAVEFAKDVIDGIREAQAEGHTTLRAIAAWLNANHYETPRGKQYTPTAVKRIIEKSA